VLDGSSENISLQKLVREMVPAPSPISSRSRPYAGPVFVNRMGDLCDDCDDGNQERQERQAEMLRHKNAKLLKENQKLSKRLAGIESTQTSSNSDLYEFEKLQSESNRLAQIIQDLEERMRATSHANLPSATDSTRIFELERHNQTLRDQLLALQSPMNNDEVLSEELTKELIEKDKLQAIKHDLEEKLKIGPGSAGSGSASMIAEVETRLEAMDMQASILRSENESMRSFAVELETRSIEQPQTHQSSIERAIRSLGSVQIS